MNQTPAEDIARYAESFEQWLTLMGRANEIKRHEFGVTWWGMSESTMPRYQGAHTEAQWVGWKAAHVWLMNGPPQLTKMGRAAFAELIADLKAAGIDIDGD